jgi:hypothetical protein
MAGRQEQAAAAQPDQQAAPAPPPQPAAPPAAPASAGLSPDALTELKQLAELHESGVLTDEEFAQQKDKILGA